MYDSIDPRAVLEYVYILRVHALQLSSSLQKRKKTMRKSRSLSHKEILCERVKRFGVVFEKMYIEQFLGLRETQ